MFFDFVAQDYSELGDRISKILMEEVCNLVLLTFYMFLCYKVMKASRVKHKYGSDTVNVPSEESQWK